MESGGKRKSTNPFDDSSSEGSEGGDNFFDCHDGKNGDPRQSPRRTSRAAPLNFDNPFDDVEQPALDFDIKPTTSSEFFSPLENAMMQAGMSTPTQRIQGFASFSDGEESVDNESSALLRGSRAGNTDNSAISELSSLSASSSAHKKSIPKEISTGKQKKRRPQKPSITTTKPNLVLKYLAGGENEFSMDYKYILLEDLGTASSWLILLLPYFAFFLSLLMASSKAIQMETTRSFSAATLCNGTIIGQPLSPAPMTSCHCHFQRHIRTRTRERNETMTHMGYAFESGILDSIPVVSTYLYGDVEFKGLSTQAVAMVAQGNLEASVQLLQRNFGANSSAPWTLMFSSVPRRVAMVCLKAGSSKIPLSNRTTWNCKTPRLLDILFSMPETAVYAGGNIRVNVFYAMRQPDPIELDDNDEDFIDVSHVYSKVLGSSELFAASAFLSSSDSYVEEIVAASSYTFEHMSHSAFALDTFVRLMAFVVSFTFMIYWCRSMGLRSLCCCRRNKPTVTLWWESPWILFPERCYILVLLLSLLLIQEPLLSAMFFFPHLGASTRLHLAADACIGVGVHGVLFVYLCLFHGFRYHTAEVARKRTEHQRRSLQLRKAAKYVAEKQNNGLSTEERISQYTSDYYEKFGDIDGSASTGHLRLQNDPCADGWADFLLFKILLFLIGVGAVIFTAYCRFPPDDDNVAHLSTDLLDRYKQGYVISIITQFSILLIWMYLILMASIESGRELRKQAFLSTRPVQLAYRILFAHVSLGFTALVVSFFFNLSQLVTKWSLQVPDEDSLGPIIMHHEEDLSHTEMMMRILSQVARQFPYSGTAASVGAGRLLFATVSILITAFIFLPAHFLEEDEDEDLDAHGHLALFNEQKRLRRDKRLVVRLARETKTWRVFPIPIERSVLEKKMLQDRGYQLYKNMHIEYNNIRERGVVSVGPYTPVFCVELACWLNEASWQAYYSPAGLAESSSASISGMNLDSIGLRLEGVVYDPATDSQAYIATNIAEQVDGDEDSVIVVAFRGTASTSNLQTDLRSRQVPLMDQITGIGSAPFCIFPDRVDIYDSDGWIWDTPGPANRSQAKCATTWTSAAPGCMPSHCARQPKSEPFDIVSKGARAILQATPVAQGSFPRVHQGFQEVYTQIRRKLLDILFPVMQRQLAKALETQDETSIQQEPLALPKIYCTGHSLGGSLAQLLALDLASNCEIVLPVASDSNSAAASPAHPGAPPEDEVFNLPSPASYQNAEIGHFKSNQSNSKRHRTSPQTMAAATREIRLQPPIAVYTFGQPRVGNKAFARFYKQKVPHTFRVVNEGDVITTMPNIVFCGGFYKHSGLAVLLDEGMTGNILVGPTVVETMFRFHQVTTNVAAHTMNRYRDCLECAFDEDELVEYYQGHNGVGKDVLGKSGNDAHIPEWMTNIRSK